MAALPWDGPKGGRVAICFDETQIKPETMQKEISAWERLEPDFPDQVAPRTVLSVIKEDGIYHGEIRVNGREFELENPFTLRGVMIDMVDGIKAKMKRGVI